MWPFGLASFTRQNVFRIQPCCCKNQQLVPRPGFHTFRSLWRSVTFPQPNWFQNRTRSTLDLMQSTVSSTCLPQDVHWYQDKRLIRRAGTEGSSTPSKASLNSQWRRVMDQYPTLLVLQWFNPEEHSTYFFKGPSGSEFIFPSIISSFIMHILLVFLSSLKLSIASIMLPRFIL